MSSVEQAPQSHMSILASREAGYVARRAIAEWMNDHPRLEDSLLAVTELVNNVVVHGQLTEDERLTVSMKPSGSAIRLTVRHHGPPFDATELPEPSSEPGAGRGLAIVGEIADRWGVEANGMEVSAWFEVAPRRRDL